MVDLEDEITKLQKKLDAVQLSADKLQKTMKQGNYEEVIPENVRQANSEKVCSDLESLICGLSGLTSRLLRCER